MQIFPHHDVDMWGCVWMSRFSGSLNFDKEYFFGFETLVFATSGIVSIHNQLVTLQRERQTWNCIISPPLTNYLNIKLMSKLRLCLKKKRKRNALQIEKNTCKLRKQFRQFDNAHAANAHNTTKYILFVARFFFGCVVSICSVCVVKLMKVFS